MAAVRTSVELGAAGRTVPHHTPPVSSPSHVPLRWRNQAAWRGPSRPPALRLPAAGPVYKAPDSQFTCTGPGLLLALTLAVATS